MTAEPNPVPTTYLWPEIAFDIAVLTVAVAARTPYGFVLVLIFVCAALVWAAHAIAAGGEARPREPRSPAEANHEWAREILARPKWIDTVRLGMRWGVVFFLTFWFSHWDEQLEPLLKVSAFIFPQMLFAACAGAFALTSWERWDARRALRRIDS